MVTGPYKINGVPLKRLNQAYCIPTSTRVRLNGVDFSEINDAYFARTKTKRKTKGEDQYFAAETEKSQEEKDILDKKKTTQATLDAALVKNVKAVPMLKQYLGSRFSLSNQSRPHEMTF